MGPHDYLNTWNISYSQKKGRESNWQFDSRSLKFKNHPNSLFFHCFHLRLTFESERGWEHIIIMSPCSCALLLHLVLLHCSLLCSPCCVALLHYLDARPWGTFLVFFTSPCLMFPLLFSLFIVLCLGFVILIYIPPHSPP
jgi:hypothetical protein